MVPTYNRCKLFYITAYLIRDLGMHPIFYNNLLSFLNLNRLLNIINILNKLYQILKTSLRFIIIKLNALTLIISCLSSLAPLSSPLLPAHCLPA
jgi:hypothetical protein